MIRRPRCLSWLALLACVASSTVNAHGIGVSYLHIDASKAANEPAARWEIAASDLLWALDLDADGDARLTSDEVQARFLSIAHLATEHLTIARGGARCRIGVASMKMTTRGAESFVSLALRMQCPKAGAIEASTSLFFGSAAYSALLDVTTRQGRETAVLSPAVATWVEPAAVSPWKTLARFLGEGIRHVMIGYDHIAFLLLLLLPSVVRSTRTGWHTVTTARTVLRDLAKIVTAFTAAHSITLALAATGTVRLPVQPIEAAIAGSIVIAGCMNLFPGAARWRLALAFGFGLVHGFGFANALEGIGVTGLAVAPMLAGFNLGVELAQLLIVVVTLPVLLVLNRSPVYARRLMPAISLAIAMTGAVWLATRV